MTSSACAADGAAGTPAAGGGPDGLRPQLGSDGSFSLFSERFGEGFHGPIGALQEARAKFVDPAQLERFRRGARLVVVDVGFGLGTNSAALLEAAQARGLGLELWGLELDPTPLAQALAAAPFRRQWQPSTLTLLEDLRATGEGRVTAPAGPGCTARLLWGDARQQIATLLAGNRQGQCDLVLLDAFSPQRCPELWSLEFLGALARLLQPQGRLLTYCCAAAVRRSLQLAGLALASIQPPVPVRAAAPSGQRPLPWSYGTVASPSPLLPCTSPLQALSAMEIEHLATRAAEPYRDPSGQADAGEILAARQRAQASSAAASTSAWRRRWHA